MVVLNRVLSIKLVYSGYVSYCRRSNPMLEHLLKYTHQFYYRTNCPTPKQQTKCLRRTETERNWTRCCNSNLPNASTRVTGIMVDTATNGCTFGMVMHTFRWYWVWYNCGKNCNYPDTGGTSMYVLLNNTITDLQNPSGDALSTP